MIVTRGITGGTRGLKGKKKQRPDCVFIDDPQTDESAKSQIGIKKRMDVITAGIANLVGHFGKNLAMICVGSVIASGDLMEQLLATPGWQSERIKMVEKFSDAHDTFWMNEYATIRNGFDRSNPTDQQRAWRDATALYSANREKADAGCVVAWQGCYRSDDGEVSAIQHAYNALIDLGKYAFAAEMQSQPLDAEDQGFIYPAAKIVKKANQFERGIVPTTATILTAFIDIQHAFFPMAICAFEPDGFTGYAVEYGAFPKQSRPYYDLENAWPTLTDYVTKQREELRGQAIEPIIAAGLDMLFTDLLGRVWQKQDGTTISLTQILVDTGYLPEIVKGAIQRVGLSPSALPLIMPSKGLAETVTKAWPKFDRKKGDVWGDYWGAKAPAIGEQRLVLVETNYWKSFLHQRLFAGIGARGSFSLYKADPTEHAMLADHLTSERASLIVDKSGQREKVQFMEPPNAKNHLLDCLVGCHVAASMRGCKLTDAQPRQQQRKKSNFSWKKAMGAA
jgi:hypothetical protein